MEIKEAIKLTIEGKKVRRPSFNNNVYISLFFGTIPKYINTPRFNQKEYFTFDIADLEATDWEIYEEEDNWNAKDLLAEHNELVVSLNYDDFVTLKEKLLQDFCDLKKIKVEDNVCYASYDEIQNIIDKRFGTE